jgi:hypothetical protein
MSVQTVPPDFARRPRVAITVYVDQPHCAAPGRRKSPRRDLRGEHPGPESRAGKSRGYASGRGERTRSSLIGLKGGEAVRQIDQSIWGRVFFWHPDYSGRNSRH